ncbi:MAG: aspartate/glutamate racemase family protein [Sphingomonadaceae bacterium]
MAEKVIGILGGMGPEATIDLFRKIVESTAARTDQEHLRIIVDNNPKIPDRTAALLHGGEDPTPLLQATARNLERAGADFIVMPCNTAHLYYDEVVEAVRIPVLHIAVETVGEVLRQYPLARTVGVLGSSGTVKLRLYHDLLEERGLRAISSPEDDQRIQDAVIHSVKAGDKGQAVHERIRTVAERLAERGAQLLLTACTELPLVLQDGDVSVPVLDPTLALARAAVRFARE